jgi:hypothetical protein
MVCGRTELPLGRRVARGTPLEPAAGATGQNGPPWGTMRSVEELSRRETEVLDLVGSHVSNPRSSSGSYLGADGGEPYRFADPKGRAG